MTTTQTKKGRSSDKRAAPTTRANDTAPTTRSGQPADAGPTFLDLPRGDCERLRVTLSEFRGRELVDVRVWYVTESGEWRPGRAGVSLRPSQVGEVVQALMLAARAADPKGGN